MKSLPLPADAQPFPVYCGILFEQSPFGSGYRELLMLTQGRRRVRVLCIAKMKAATFHREELTAVKPLSVSPARMKRRLRANAKTFHTSKALLIAALRAAASIDDRKDQ